MPESTGYFRDLMNELNDLGVNEQHRQYEGLVQLAGVVNGKLLKMQLVTPRMLVPGHTRKWDAATKASLKQQQQVHIIEQLQSAGLINRGDQTKESKVFVALEAWANCFENDD